MGRDNQPKHRQKQRELRRFAARRAPYERLLIVCEGEKTEPNYFNEIRDEFRLTVANVQACQGAFGTQPLRVVEYAEYLFQNGNREKEIQARAFDCVYAVFDRDDHSNYHDALAKSKALSGKLKNDSGMRIPFNSIPSVPCFELWLLLHFEEVLAPIHRDDVYGHLKRFLPDYDKGQEGHWASTKHFLDIASERARERSTRTTAYDGTEPYTDVHELVSRLMHLKDSAQSSRPD